ncbi:MAG TPA: hypothetical protein VGH16_12455 [Candidatus Binatia bacterium]|jgi:hypothetical protein
MEAHQRIALGAGAATTSETIATMPGGSPDFSLVLGGPLFQAFRRTHLSDDALELLARRVVVISTFCWLPLLILSITERRAVGGVVVPFLYDIDLHMRFLLAMPLMIIAELVVHKRLAHVVTRFEEYELIPASEKPRYDAIVRAALGLRNSILAELLLLAFVYGFGVLYLWRGHLALSTATWYGDPAAGRVNLTRTGMWYVYVSLPFFQFLLFRWYFRLFIWGRLLWQTARIKLNLIPMHPDGVGGLGFLSHIVYAFSPLLLAHGCILAGLFLNRILYMGASLGDFKMDILGAVIFLLLILLGPLMFFTPQLAAAKRAASREYGVLAEQYVRDFNAKWLADGSKEELLGAVDIQSLADMGNSYQTVRTMRPVPFTKETIIQLVILTLAPVVPVTLTMISFDELLKKLLGILF